MNRIKKQIPYEEITDLISLRAVIMSSTANQNPFYFEHFGIFETDSLLITSFISAISSFVDQIDEEYKGFQMMRSEGLVVLTRRTAVSALTVISKQSLSENFLNKLSGAQEVIEALYEPDIEMPSISLENFDPNVIANMFEDFHVKLHLLRGVILDKDRLNEMIYQGSISRAKITILKPLLMLPEELLQELRIDTMINHFQLERQMTFNDAARIITLAYENKILTQKVFVIQNMI